MKTTATPLSAPFTLDDLNHLMTLANRMAWSTLVVGMAQYDEGLQISHSNAAPDFNAWNMVTENGFSLQVVKEDFLGVKP